MNIVVFGATGPTGRHVLERALARGHTVRAVARTPSALDLRHAALTVVQGDVLDPASVTAAIAGQDVVLSALGARNRTTGGSAVSATVATDGMRNIVDGMRTHGVRRLIVLSSVGVGATKGRTNFVFDRIIRPLFLGRIFADKDKMEELVRASGLDWIIVQPTRLTDGPARDRIVVKADPPVPFSISRADVAHFLVDQVTDNRWLGQAPVIGG